MSMRLTPYLALAALLLVGADAHGANPPAPSALDLPPSNIMPAPVDMSPNAAAPVVRQSDPSGNPLWAIPLSALTATRDRPLFTPSRRPPAAAVAGTPVVAPPPPPPPPAQEEPPPLIFVGAVVSETEGFAIFLDQQTNRVVRLKLGQDHAGWVLKSVKAREATLQKDRQSATLALPAPGAGGGFPMPAGAPGVPASVPGVPGVAPPSVPIGGLRPGQKEPEL